MMKLTENQASFLSDFDKLYGLDLSALVVHERSNTRVVTIMTDKISDLDIMSLERFCRHRKLRIEPNGYKALAIFL